MANPEHLAILKQGVEAWNAWRLENPSVEPDLSQVDFAAPELPLSEFGPIELDDIDLSAADLRLSSLRYAACLEANLDGANLVGADLCFSTLENCSIRNANLRLSRLGSASFLGCDLSGSDLAYATTEDTSFEGSILRGAILKNIGLIKVSFDNAVLDGCMVYGTGSWDVSLEGTKQQDLVITEIDPAVGLTGDGPILTVDNLEVAQFIYLLLKNERIRDVIDTITSKVVLILGRFSQERRVVLDAIREELRRRNFTPVLFDFDKPVSKDVTGTVETLARMARFIVADLTHPSSIPHELATVVPFLRTTPVLSLRRAGSGGYSMFEDLQRAYDWVLDETYEYEDGPSLIEALPEVIAPAEQKVKQLRGEADGGRQK